MRYNQSMEKAIREIIKQGEGNKVEFKECQHSLNKDVYESVCAFLNTNGGEILLGVRDDGTIQGVLPDCVEQIKKDFINNINNSNKLNPTVYLAIETVTIDNKTVIYVGVPESSDVHRCNGRIFVRNNDADQDITDKNALVAKLYMRKQKSFSENEIYPFVTIGDLRSDLITRVRKTATLRKTDHIWADMDDMELLKSAKLYHKDYSTNKEGFTLAAILLFGKDEVIASVLPHYKTDLIVRIKNPDRYDDRDIVTTNLIESYDRIMAFVEKHLPEPFYLEKDIRIDLRSRIFREVASNILVHREYLSPYPAKMVIEKDKIYTENGNKPYIHGNIDPDNFRPFPKNPTIAGFFREIGRAEELGSGVKNLFKYCKEYAGSDPIIEDGDIFTLTINTNITAQDKTAQGEISEESAQDSAQVSAQDEIAKIIEFCKEEKSLQEIMEFLGVTHRGYFKNKTLEPLIEKGFIKLTIPDKPTSKNQKYVAGSMGEVKND